MKNDLEKVAINVTSTDWARLLVVISEPLVDALCVEFVGTWKYPVAARYAIQTYHTNFVGYYCWSVIEIASSAPAFGTIFIIIVSAITFLKI